jgi:hypothetical protein
MWLECLIFKQSYGKRNDSARNDFAESFWAESFLFLPRGRKLIQKKQVAQVVGA